MYTVQLDFKINSLILWAFFQTSLQVLTQSVEILVNICCSGYSKVVHLQKHCLHTIHLKYIPFKIAIFSV